MFNGEVDDLETLHDANSRFYRAVEDLDLPAMESLWQHDGWVRCIHPGWDALIGWEQVRASIAGDGGWPGCLQKFAERIAA